MKTSKKRDLISENELRKKRALLKESYSPDQVLLANLLQLKFKLEDYLNQEVFNETQSFGFYLRSYLHILDKKNNTFANEIDINVTELSQILNKHRNPSEKVLIRIELHSNGILPAILWHRLIEKEKEHELLTNFSLRVRERSHVNFIVNQQTRVL
jgi:hypothetical protein